MGGGGNSVTLVAKNYAHRVLRPNITIFFTILAVAVSFAWLGVQDPSKWQAGVVLYILGRECASLAPYLNGQTLTRTFPVIAYQVRISCIHTLMGVFFKLPNSVR